MAFLTLVFQFFTSAFLIGYGSGHPVTASYINSTHMILRSGKAYVVFPITEMADSKWGKILLANISKESLSDSLSDEPLLNSDTLKKQNFIPAISKRSPKCAKDSTFCEHIEDYPGDYLTYVLADKIDEFKEILGVDEVKQQPSIGQRIDDIEELSLCASMEQVVYPKTAKNKDDKWLYVVNQSPYLQGVRIEKCLKTSDDKDMPCQFPEPLGYKTVCKQKYIYRKLVALDEQGKPVTDTFQLPSCCSCKLKAMGLRMGAPRNTTILASTTSPIKETSDVA